MKTSARTPAPLLEISGLDLFAPGGRPLIQNLNLRVGREQAAIIGRNGVGKSSLLQLLASDERPARGSVVRRTAPWLVPQQLPDETHTGCSPGELRKLRLREAKLRKPEFLILDEPTQDLDEVGIAWLLAWLRDWDGGLIVVSHQRRLLSCFQHFLVIAESGCRYVPGSLEAPGVLGEHRRDPGCRVTLNHQRACQSRSPSPGALAR